MEYEEFAKILTIDGAQILFHIVDGDTGEGVWLQTSANVNGMFVSVKAGPFMENNATILEKANEETGKVFMQAMTDLLQNQ